MKTYKTEAARTAAVIKAELKAKFPNIKFSVKSDTYSMGDSVQVRYNYNKKAPALKEVEAITQKYEAGYFDGMTDCYEYTHKGTGPTAKFIFVNQEYPEEVHAMVRAMGLGSAGPEAYNKAFSQELRVWEYEQEGMTRSDAQGIVMAEDMKVGTCI